MTKKTTLNKLIGNTWLENLPLKAKTELLEVAKIKTYQANQLVHSKNSEAYGLYAVISGEVRISATTSSGEEIVFTRITAGQWFGEVALLDGGVRTHDGFTTVESELAILPKESVLIICKKYPEIYSALVSLLCDHCRQAFSAIDDFLLFTPEQRIAKLLLKRFKLSNQKRVNISQYELGALIGISRQSTNKILKSWETKGFIKRYYRSLEVIKAYQLNEIIEC
ncbi:MAG: Crp/Fnr family transcriptional regulator [Colwellia sp.]|nr:Crp/Fnr family transcriptional regulator [Colwellia sp.]